MNTFSGMRILLLSLLFFISFTIAADEYSFYKLSLEDGLSSNSVYRIEQDSTGYMWFGTFSGLNRYDGSEIKTYKPEPGDSKSLSSPVIFDLFEDSEKRLWVATDGGGLNLYNRLDDDFTVFRHDSNNENSISSNNVYSLCGDGLNRLWVGTGGGGLNLFNTETGRFSVFRADRTPDSLDSNIIRALYSDNSGVLWIGTEGGGLSRFDNSGSFRNYRKDESSVTAISSDTVRSIFEDTQGHLWIGTEGGGLNLFDRKEGTFRVIDNRYLKSPLSYSVRSINEDKDGNIWVGTEGQGVFIINKRGDILSSIRNRRNVSSSLSKDKIRDIFIDRNGLIWIGTRDGAVNRYNPRTIGFKVNSNTDIREIYEDLSGNLWIGTDGGGLTNINSVSGSITSYRHNKDNINSLSSNQVYSILEDRKGDLWIGTDGGGLNHYNIKEDLFKRYTYSADDPLSINSNTVWSLFEDNQGTLWVGTEGGGLNYFNRETGDFHSFQSVPENEKTLNGNSIRTIFEDSRGILWIGTWDGGLNRYNREDNNFTRFTRDPHNILSLSDSSVNTIFEDSSGQLWIGTAAGGLNLMDRERQTFTHYGTDEGISGDNIFGILEDGMKNLWISTDRGLTRFNPSTGHILNFGEADGLPGNEFSVNACTQLKSGELIFGGPHGINRFFPENISVNRIIPPLVITDISVMNESINYIQESDSTLLLTHNDNILSITFAVLDFAAPERNRYAVILEGLQDQWTNLDNQNSIVYTSLPAGDYTFRVKGADNNGIWNEKGAFLRIKVKPPWWETPFFYVMVFLLGSLMIFTFIRQRLNRLEQKNRELREYSIHIQNIREEERTSVAREVHDELGQTLSALKMEIFRMSGGKRESMLELVDMSLESVKDLSTRLRPKVLDNLSLGEAVTWLVRDFSRHTGIHIREELDEKLHISDMDIKTALFRIIQEVLTNVLRHSGADTVQISLHLSNGSILLKIGDNGCGIEEESFDKNRSFGIRGMKERCRHLNGQFRIGRAEGGGTEIRVSIPVRERKINA